MRLLPSWPVRRAGAGRGRRPADAGNRSAVPATPEAEQSTRVLIVDHHPVSLRGLAREVQAADGLEVVAAVGDPTEAVLIAQEMRPAVAVYGAYNAAYDPVRATRELLEAAPGIAVLIFGGAEAIARAAITAGAAGWVAKSAPVPFVLEAIVGVARGDIIIGRAIRSGGVRRAVPRVEPGPKLTVREWEVLHLLEEGLNAAQIAERLIISRNTARNYVQNVLTKLGAHSKLEAVAVARRSRLFGAA